MRVSYRWLQEFTACQQIAVEQIADKLTMAGLEVEGIEYQECCVPETVVVGEIRDVQRHAEAPELFICQVDIGRGEGLTIVCGAPNTRRGQKVAVALPDTRLPNGLTVNVSKIRGILSQGMICAEDELGLSADHTGILVLPDHVPLGKPFTPEMIGFEDDVVLEVGLTPNRGDCLSHLGIAREIATLFGLQLQRPPVDYPEEDKEIHQIASVSIQDPDLCHRYTASVITGVTIGPSPLWLRARLERVGIRAINNVVDVTNYVMMELGQPLHAFDLEKLEGRQIIVRRAHPDERFTTLDDTERRLDEQTLMICDAQRSVAVAGVMGGVNSEVSETTAQILLESAWFAPASIRKTAKKLGMTTEACYRFERHVDLLGVDIALRRATRLIAELGGGTAARGIIDVFPLPYIPVIIELRPQRIQSILGTPIALRDTQHILSNLGFDVSVEPSQKESLRMIEVEVPSYRPDVTREIDLIEEIARIYGYDAIPTASPAGKIPPKFSNPRYDIELLIKNVLVSQGMYEVINFSFSDQKHLEFLSVAEREQYNAAVSLRNPLNAGQEILRTTLLPGLLGNIELNASQRAENMRFFEIGNVFRCADPAASLPEETTFVSGVMTGSRQDRGWNQTPAPIDFYDVKGIVEQILIALGIVAEFHQSNDVPFLHPGEAAAVTVGDQMLGVVGKIHPDVVEAFQLDLEQMYLFELSVDRLTEQCALQRIFRPLPKFPAVHRDLAVVVPQFSVQASDIEACILEAGKPLLERVVLFDRYVGPQIADECVGLTYALTYRSSETTLTDDEVTSIHQRIINHLNTHLGIVLRQ